MTLSEKKQLLGHLLDEVKQKEYGGITRLARDLRRTTAAIRTWTREAKQEGEKEHWPPRETEALLWELLGYELHEDGSVRPKAEAPEPSALAIVIAAAMAALAAHREHREEADARSWEAQALLARLVGEESLRSVERGAQRILEAVSARRGRRVVVKKTDKNGEATV